MSAAGEQDSAIPEAYWKHIPKVGKLYEVAARYFLEEHGKSMPGR